MKRIALIEDDPMYKNLWKSCIIQAEPGAQIYTYVSVEDALSSFANKKIRGLGFFDAIIVDIFLSGEKTGIDFVSHLTPAQQRKTIVSSSINKASLERELNFHRVKCVQVSKPFDFDEVQAALRKVLRPFRTRLTLVKNEQQVARLEPSSENYKPVILVTGCSSGIGAELAKKLYDMENYRLVLTAREKSLAKVRENFPESDRVMVQSLDLTVATDIERITQTVTEKWGRADILINNAGISFRSAMEQMDAAAEAKQMQTNYLGPMALIRALLPMMRENGRGKIINVSSVSGIMGMPTMGSYAASKHALEGASESLWYELAPLGINVCVVRPGFINSDGYQHVLRSKKSQVAENLSGPYADLYMFMRPFVAYLMNLSPTSSEGVAGKVMQLIKTQNPPLWNNATTDALVFSVLKKILPNKWFHKLVFKGIYRIGSWGQGYSHAKKERLAA